MGDGRRSKFGANSLQKPGWHHIPEYRRGDLLSGPWRRLVIVMSNLDVVVDVGEMFVVKVALVLAYLLSVHRPRKLTLR